jgi:hypothetical protein
VSREVGESLERCFIVEASEPCAVIGLDEVKNIAASMLVALEGAGMAALWPGSACKSEALVETPVESLGHAVGLRPVRSGQLMSDLVSGAEKIDRVLAGRLTFRLALFVVGEAIGPFAAIVGEDGVHLARKMLKKALEEGSGRLGCVIGKGLDIDITCGPIDGDEGIGRLAVELGQILHIEVDEAEGPIGFKALVLVLLGPLAGGDAMA